MQEVSLACQGLRPRGTGRALAIARPAMLPSATRTASASRTRSLSRLNTWPTNTPVNASSQTSRPDTHNSGPIWLALPFIVRDLSSSPLAGLPAHPRRFAPRNDMGTRAIQPFARAFCVSSRVLSEDDRHEASQIRLCEPDNGARGCGTPGGRQWYGEAACRRPEPRACSGVSPGRTQHVGRSRSYSGSRQN